jgi:DNA-binding NarL/FixJ family response regulator
MVLSVARYGPGVASALAGLARTPEETAFAARALGLAQKLDACVPHAPVAQSKQAGLLSPRELQILRELVNGLSNKEIARRLAIAESTVKTHKERLYEKLGASSRSAAIETARSHGLLVS